jgi:hypothetical protein
LLTNGKVLITGGVIQFPAPPDAELYDPSTGIFKRRAWQDGYTTLSVADQATPLALDDLERLASAAYLTGREADYRRLLIRAHHACIEAGDEPRAARCAFWLGLQFLLRDEPAQANGWLAGARRLAACRECVERGYVLLPAAEQQLGAGNAAEIRVE